MGDKKDWAEWCGGFKGGGRGRPRGGDVKVLKEARVSYEQGVRASQVEGTANARTPK